MKWLKKKALFIYVNNEELNDKEILRLSIIAELDASSLYEEFANKAVDPDIKEVLLDVAKEEKTHVGEFQALLLELDQEQKNELIEGNKEVKELTE